MRPKSFALPWVFRFRCRFSGQQQDDPSHKRQHLDRLRCDVRGATLPFFVVTHGAYGGYCFGVLT